ncbi:MAG: hypothetical protein ACI9DF_003937 [Verrucomicrobiales bacterium]|jgi:hypothetical protein
MALYGVSAALCRFDSRLRKRQRATDTPKGYLIVSDRLYVDDVGTENDTSTNKAPPPPGGGGGNYQPPMVS